MKVSVWSAEFAERVLPLNYITSNAAAASSISIGRDASQKSHYLIGKTSKFLDGYVSTAIKILVIMI